MNSRCTVWVLNGTTVETLHGAMTLLDEEERRQAAAYRDETAARSFVLRRSLTKSLLGDSLGVPPISVQITRRCAFCGHLSHGKPQLVGHELGFSVSWSGSWVAVAVAPQGQIGLDIEMLRGCEPSPDHWAAVHGSTAQPSETSEQAMLQIWTRKEAVLKCAGIGMAISLDAIAVTPPDAPPAVVSLPDGLGLPTDYHLYELRVDAAVVMSMAADRATDIELRNVPTSEFLL
jgi:4'-phosphopantetheinyl transferase